MKIRAAAAALTIAGIVALPAGAAQAKPPKACLRALDRAEEVFSDASTMFSSLNEYFTELAAASERATAAGSTYPALIQLVQDLTTAGRPLLDDFTVGAPRIGELRQEYNADAAKCRRAL